MTTDENSLYINSKHLQKYFVKHENAYDQESSGEQPNNYSNLSELERRRADNIKRNNERLKQLGFFDRNNNNNNNTEEHINTTLSKEKRTRKRNQNTPRERQSSRLANIYSAAADFDNCVKDDDDLPLLQKTFKDKKSDLLINKKLSDLKQENINTISIELNEVSSDELKIFILSKKNDDEYFHSDLVIISDVMITKVNAFMGLMNESKLKIKLNAIIRK